MIFDGDPKLYQSSPGETGQLMGINTRTFALEVFYKSFLYRAQISGDKFRNKLLEYACPVWNSQQASFSQTRSCP